jgi:hypothetical protein
MADGRWPKEKALCSQPPTFSSANGQRPSAIGLPTFLIFLM